jgi:hypothetical protein
VDISVKHHAILVTVLKTIRLQDVGKSVLVLVSFVIMLAFHFAMVVRSH